MTSTSLFGGGVAYYDDTAHAADDPLSTHIGTALANNALHLADSAGQVRVCWPPGNGVEMTPSQAITNWDVSAASEGRIKIPFGPFPMLLRPDGAPYPMRVRLAGRSTSGILVGFKLILAPAGRGFGYASVDDTADNVETFSTISFTTAWLSPSGSSILSLGAEEVERRTISVLDSNDLYRDIPIALGELVVICEQASGATARARLGGLYAAEYYAES